MLIDEEERLLRVLGGFMPLPQLAIPSFSSSFVPFHFPRRLDGEFVVAGATQRRWFGGAARGGGVWREKGKAETRGELGDLIGFSLVKSHFTALEFINCVAGGLQFQFSHIKACCRDVYLNSIFSILILLFF